ncbi:hypothetical protein AMS68_002720 [Peltaster fructicola]|uniref:Cell wall mannoprotein PIR1-like C-terminal domain-containing protein n=1 Tax=Peltaster fructicola TaxID=286661 RepID=A0A6H0XR76_9PEZI|nr:hypothetical protein AMS68_002720 [Peltaster fructicola]
MQYSLALLGLVAAVYAVPQGVTSAIAPSASAPAGCQTSYSGSFEIETINATTSKRDLESRQANTLTVMLQNGVLTDSQGRTGYIAANSQFQFDAPPQTGAIYTAGWSVCGNGSLAIGGTTLFKQCLSGDFYNLYLINDAPQCSPIYIDVIPVGSSATVASQLSDGQPQATPVPICQLSDGQAQATQCKPVTQISDGQIQATTAKNPVTQISDGQIQATTAKNPITQISDGQIQGPTANPVTQISDGQIQATTARASYVASTTRAAAAYTGAAAPVVRGEAFGLAAGVLALALL